MSQDRSRKTDKAAKAAVQYNPCSKDDPGRYTPCPEAELFSVSVDINDICGRFSDSDNYKKK